MRVNKIRVLLANHPMMIPDDIRKLLAAQEDIELVGDLRGPMNILQATGRTMADAVILVQEGMEEPGLCSQLLAVYPDLTILSVTSDLASAFTQQLCSRRRTIVNAQHEEIIQELRVAVREPCSRKGIE
jgi:DNA-binding NarL/FixJ family response regulator